MEYDILLATNNRSVSNNFKKALHRRIKLDTIDTPSKLNRAFRRKGEMLEVIILDLTFTEKDLNRFIFYIKQFKKDIPVILLHIERSLIRSEAFRNLSVYGCIRRPANKGEAEEILNDLNNIFDLDMDKKFEKVEYLEQENVFACTFKNRKTYFLSRKDIPEDDNTKIKNYDMDEDRYHFTVYLESGAKYEVVWDFVRYICDEKYEYHKSKTKEGISSEKIGTKISQLRELKKLTQEGLAKKTGIQRANVARIEGGKHYPSLETLENIAEALEVPIAKFLVK
jgi:DNA-binding XRE family transcriptional regulator